jgi:hypothetical protein
MKQLNRINILSIVFSNSLRQAKFGKILVRAGGPTPKFRRELYEP